MLSVKEPDVINHASPMGQNNLGVLTYQGLLQNLFFYTTGVAHVAWLGRLLFFFSLSSK